MVAMFQFNNLVTSYEANPAPFAFDLLLLQGSRFNRDFWRPVLADLQNEEPGTGRVVTCEAPLTDVEVFQRFMSTLGLQSVRVVAFAESASLVAEVQRAKLGIFSETLLFEQGGPGPKGDELVRVVREFCGF